MVIWKTRGRKEERMTKLLSQDDQEDGDDINQKRGEAGLETKRRKFGGGSETSRHHVPTMLKVEARNSDLGIFVLELIIK